MSNSSFYFLLKSRTISITNVLKEIGNFMNESVEETKQENVETKAMDVNEFEKTFHLFSKPYYIFFSLLNKKDLNEFSENMKSKGYSIYYYLDDDVYYMGAIEKYFHSYRRAVNISRRLPKGIAKYSVAKIEAKYETEYK